MVPRVVVPLPVRLVVKHELDHVRAVLDRPLDGELHDAYAVGRAERVELLIRNRLQRRLARLLQRLRDRRRRDAPLVRVRLRDAPPVNRQVAVLDVLAFALHVDAKRDSVARRLHPHLRGLRLAHRDDVLLLREQLARALVHARVVIDPLEAPLLLRLLGLQDRRRLGRDWQSGVAERRLRSRRSRLLIRGVVAGAHRADDPDERGASEAATRSGGTDASPRRGRNDRRRNTPAGVGARDGDRGRRHRGRRRRRHAAASPLAAVFTCGRARCCERGGERTRDERK